MEVISKFTIGSDEGVDQLFTVIKSSVSHTYKQVIPEENIRKYIDTLDPRKMINELNDLSNQLIITYADHQPIGYGILKSGSAYPGFSGEKRITELKLAILEEYDSPETKESLWKKCKAAATFTDVVWINILTADPLLKFLEEAGFTIIGDSHLDPFQCPSYIMEMEIKKN